MKWSKPCMCFLVIAVVAVSLLCSNAKADEQAGDKIAFRWAFGALVGPEQGRKFVPITADIALRKGDQLKFMLELHKACHVYLIYQSSQNDMNLLFPYQLNQFSSDYELMKMYYIPHDDSWFTLDDTSGAETFHLIASVTRLHELEALFKTTTAGADGSRRAELVRSAIKALKKQHRTLTASAERPVPIGGNVRAVDKDVRTSTPDMGTVAIEVSAKDFYCRTFTIEHK